MFDLRLGDCFKILDTLEEVFDSNLFLEQLSVSDKVRILHFLLNINKKLLLLIENFAYGSVKVLWEAIKEYSRILCSIIRCCKKVIFWGNYEY